MFIILFNILLACNVIMAMERQEIPELPLELQINITKGSKILSGLKTFLYDSSLCGSMQFIHPSDMAQSYERYSALISKSLPFEPGKYKQVIPGDSDLSTDLNGDAVAPVAGGSMYVAAADGRIYTMRQIRQGQLPKWAFAINPIQIHKGEIIFLWFHNHTLFTSGEDGFVHLWQGNGFKLIHKKTFNFKEKIGCCPKQITLCSPYHFGNQTRYIIKSAHGDYCFFDENFNFLSMIAHEDIEQLHIPKERMFLAKPAIFKELIKLNRGVSFATYQLLRGIELAIEKNNILYIHPKQEELLAHLPLVVAYLTEEGYIRKRHWFAQAIDTMIGFFKHMNLIDQS